MASPLYTMDPYSPTTTSSILPNISTSRTASRSHNSQSFIATWSAASPPSPSTPTSASSFNRKGTPQHIARPINAFMLFRSAFLKESRIPSHAETRQQHLSKVIGQCWNLMSPAERAVWDAKAEEAKREHAAMYPGYKFSPKRKSKAQARAQAQAQAQATVAGTSAKRAVSAGAKARGEGAEREKEEEIQRLRELFTHYKGEPVLSRRNEKKLARSVRGTERAARPAGSRRRAAKSSAASSVSTSTPAASTSSSTASTATTSPDRSSPPAPASVDSAASIFSTLLSPVPLRPLCQTSNGDPFLPSTTLLSPAPSTGPQITRLAQSPPLTPFHPSDRQAQMQSQFLYELQHQEQQDVQFLATQNQMQHNFPLNLCAPYSAPAGCSATEMGMEGAFNANDLFGAVSMYEGTVYPGLGKHATTQTEMPPASMFFNQYGARAAAKVASGADGASVNPPMNTNTNMNMYLNFDTAGTDSDYAGAFADAYASMGVGISYEAPTPTFAPVVSPAFSRSSSSWSPPAFESTSSDILSPASLAYPDSPITPLSTSSSSSPSFSSEHASPASLAYPDSPNSPVTPATPTTPGLGHWSSAPTDCTDTLAYPFPSPDGAAHELTLSAPYAVSISVPFASDGYKYDCDYGYGASTSDYQDHWNAYPWSQSGSEQQQQQFADFGVGANELQVELGNMGCF